MINLGRVKPGSTIEFPFGSFAGSTGAPSATTGSATSDIQIYKDGGTTQRASASGITFTVDFDSLTGVNYVSIDLSDNTTADFYAAGSRYTVVVSDVTIDGQTMRFPLGTFRIGMESSLLDTTIASLSSQTSFTLTAGSADDNAYIGCVAYIHDAASAVQCAIGVVSAYTGSTKTVTLAGDPGIFTMAAKDNISLLPPNLLVNGTAAGRVKIASGYLAMTWADIAAPTTSVNLSGTTIATTQKVDVETIKTQAVTAAAGVTFPSSIASPTNITAGTITTATNVTTVNGLASGVITATSIAADAITAAKIADGAIDAATFAAGAINAAAIASDAITAAKIADGAIDAATFAAGAINAAAIAADAITDAKVASDVTIASVTGAVGSVTAAVTITGDLSATMKASVNAEVDTAIADAALATAANLAVVIGYVDTEVAAIKAVTDKIDNTLTSTSDGYVFSGVALQAVWDEPMAGHLVSGTTGAALNAAGSAGDPWATTLPGAYGPGTAGYKLAAVDGTVANLDTMLEATSDAYTFTPDALQFAPTGGGGGLDAAGVRAAIGLASANLDTQLSGLQADTDDIQSRLPAALVSGRMDSSVGAMAANTLTASALASDAVTEIQSGLATATALATVDTVVDAIQAKTDNLPADPADASDISGSFSTVNSTLGTIAGYLDTEIAAIKAKTDNLPASPAATSDIPSAGAIADAVWDEAVSGHTSSGTFGKALDDADDRGARTVVRGTVAGSSTTTSILTSAFSPSGAAADQFKGRIVIFDNDTATAELRGQATDITASSNSATPTLTVTALTTAPASGDSFSVL